MTKKAPGAVPLPALLAVICILLLEMRVLLWVTCSPAFAFISEISGFIRSHGGATFPLPLPVHGRKRENRPRGLLALKRLGTLKSLRRPVNLVNGRALESASPSAGWMVEAGLPYIVVWCALTYTGSYRRFPKGY